MTDDEVVALYHDMLNRWPNLPNPEHEPKRFAYYVRLYHHVNSR